MIQVLRRNWPALLVIALVIHRAVGRDDLWSIEGLCLAVATVGVLMNVVVILANGGMPVAATREEIPEEMQPTHHPSNERTRLAILGDWIDVGWAYYSPGDIVIDVGVIGLIATIALRWFFPD